MAIEKIKIPPKVVIKIMPCSLILKGPLGTKNIEKNVNFNCKLSANDSLLVCSFSCENKISLLEKKFGTFITKIKNTIKGITNGFFIELKLNGVGYRFLSYEKNILKFKVGFCNDLEYEVNENIEVLIESPVSLSLFSNDYELLKEVAAKIRSFRKPDSYKGKGFSYSSETLNFKEIKKN